MVTKLNRPVVNDAETVVSIVAERQNGVNADFFTSILLQWQDRIRSYEIENGNPETIQRWPVAQENRVKFHNLYLSPHAESFQKPLLDSLRSRTLQLCPACGEDGTPNTLDHYLPKDLYPEFSITCMNLFPMCDFCQTAKGTKTVDSDNKRFFVHPYFDSFVETQIAILKIGRPLNSPESITIEPHPDLDPQQSALVERHISELDLYARYYRFFRSEYLRLLRLVKRLRSKNQSVPQNLAIFQEYTADKSVNSWGHIFYAGVLADPVLLQHLENGELPEFL